MSKINKAIIGVVLLVVVLAVWRLYDKPVAPSVQAQIKVGVVLPFSGDAASYGESMKKAIELAKQNLRLDFVTLVYEDGKCDAKTAVSAATKLATVDKVVGIIGEACSDATLAAAPVAEQNKIALISPASTSQAVSGAGDYVFRVVPSDALQGDFAANLVFNKGLRKLAVVFVNDDYGNGFKSVLQTTFEQLGGQVVAAEGFSRDATDLRTQLTKIKAASPDSIYIISNAPAAGVVALKQIKELALPGAVFGAEALKSDYVVRGAGPAAEGFAVTSVSAGTGEFEASYKNKYGEAPGPFGAQAYDAFMAIGKALGQGHQSGEAIKSRLYSLEFNGATGHIKFDSNGDVSGNYDVYLVQNGEYVLQK